MPARPVRILVLICSALFIWPPHCCCVLARQTPTPAGQTSEAPVAVAAKTSGCPRCCHDDHDDGPTKPPAENSPRPPAHRCPCGEVHTAAAALPPVVKVQTDSFAVAVVVATPAIVPASVRGAEHGRWE